MLWALQMLWLEAGVTQVSGLVVNKQCPVMLGHAHTRQHASLLQHRPACPRTLVLELGPAVAILNRFYTCCSYVACRSAPLISCTADMSLAVIGGGVTQLVMPNLADGIAKHTYTFRAWRWAFFFPGCLQIIWGLAILAFSQVCCKQDQRCRPMLHLPDCAV